MSLNRMLEWPSGHGAIVRGKNNFHNEDLHFTFDILGCLLEI